ncbi:sporulation membrane protein YtaF [Alkaliphilus transvaalensis]|uniref:sporulation membrane protein YtaF n=1 Tax=Alkaliphilus transvaalensis TaxID=114628 RepID=UPI00047906E6|nr:sporulation membrane protein YtaF [Alkaliphilus transvaalensis]
MLQGILIAIAISIDSFSVGVAYGIRDIKVPLRSVLILDFISVALLSIGFFAGNLLSRFVLPGTSEILGAITILIIGLWYFTQGWLNYKFPTNQSDEVTSIATFSIKSLGVAINILRSPFDADLDISGEIDTKEAILLGFALAIDSLAVGVAVSISSFTIIFVTLGIVAVMNLLLLFTGMHLGKQFLATHLGKRTPLIPGIILITLGFIRLFKF